MLTIKTKPMQPQIIPIKASLDIPLSAFCVLTSGFISKKNVDKEVLNENNNGTFVNLSSLNDDIINNLESYLTYVTKQEKQLGALENQKEEFKVKYFQKENKDNSLQLSNER